MERQDAAPRAEREVPRGGLGLRRRPLPWHCRTERHIAFDFHTGHFPAMAEIVVEREVLHASVVP